MFEVCSNWTSPTSDALLELYLSKIKSWKNHPNLNKYKYELLHSLMCNDQILIKPSDKGSMVVV